MTILIQSLTVLLEGLISFFSPCVIPLLPLYLGYLAGNSKEKDKDGNVIYKRSKVLIHTLFFVLGISMSFFILGISFTTLGSLLKEYKSIIAIVGSIIIIILGLFQMKVINFKFLQREKKLKLNINPNKMNPIVAFFMGFIFSFAWTPCVGPALSSVLIMASSAESMFLGNLLVLIYAIGFIIPFLVLGLSTTTVLNFLKRKQNVLENIVKVGGLLLVLVGCYTLVTNIDMKKEAKTTENCTINEETGLASCKQGGKTTSLKKKYKIDKLTLKDQNNKPYNWENYKDKTVILHFWQTDCIACRNELKELKEVYTHYNQNKDEVILLSIVSPELEHKKKSTIKDFIEQKKINFPVLIDETGEFFEKFEIISYPSTFIVKESTLELTIPGATTKEKLTESVDKIKNE